MPKKKVRKPAGRRNLASRLADMQADWAKGEPRTVGAPIPDDNYPMRIASAVVEEAKSSGRLQVNWGLVVIEGDYASEERVLHKYSGMTTPENLDFLQGDIQTLELDIPPDLSDIGDTLGDAIDLEVEVNVNTRQGFTNYNFVELLQASGSDEPEEVAESASSEYPEDAVIRKMSREELEQLTTDWDIGVNPKKFKTVEALRKAVLKA